MARNCDRRDATSMGERPALSRRSKPCGGGGGPDLAPLTEGVSSFAYCSSVSSGWGWVSCSAVVAARVSASSSVGESWVLGDMEQWM